MQPLPLGCPGLFDPCSANHARLDHADIDIIIKTHRPGNQRPVHASNLVATFRHREPTMPRLRVSLVLHQHSRPAPACQPLHDAVAPLPLGGPSNGSQHVLSSR
jgi:hypothetical protein